MWEIARDILTSPFGSFASVFGIVIFLLWLAVKAGSITEKFKLVNKLESSIDKIKDDMSIVKAFIEIDNRNNNPFAQRNSPISLNDIGRKVSEQLQSNQIESNH